MENKGYPEVNLDSWIKVGEGGNGVTYEHPDKPDLLLKLNNGRSSSYEVVKEEFDTSAAGSRTLRGGGHCFADCLCSAHPAGKIYYRILLGSLMKFFYRPGTDR